MYRHVLTALHTRGQFNSVARYRPAETSFIYLCTYIYARTQTDTRGLSRARLFMSAIGMRRSRAELVAMGKLLERERGVKRGAYIVYCIYRTRSVGLIGRSGV